ncbi:MAG: hypothetical protein MHM6MM_006247 [Cercozoa sp. M6MM]
MSYSLCNGKYMLAPGQQGAYVLEVKSASGNSFVGETTDSTQITVIVESPEMMPTSKFVWVIGTEQGGKIVAFVVSALGDELDKELHNGMVELARSGKPLMQQIF